MHDGSAGAGFSLVTPARKLKACAVWLLCTGFGAAQTPPGPVRLTLDQAIAAAIRNHPRVAVAQNLEAAAGQRVAEERSAYFPVINGEITGTQGLNNSRIGAGSLPASLLFNRQGQGIDLSQVITNFGRTRNLVAWSRLQEQAQHQNTTATRFDIALGVARAYYEVLQDQALVRVAEETVRARQTLANQVGALAGAQLRSQLDVSFADVNLSEAQLMLIRARDTVDQSYADLARAMGEDRPAPAYQLAEPALPPAPPEAINSLITQAIQNRPELAELRLQYEAAQRFEEAERDLKRPNITFFGVAGALPYINQDPRIAPYGYEGAMLNVQIPIFNGHLFTAREREAYYQSIAANQRLRDLQQQVEHDVRAAVLTAQNAYQRIPVTERLLNQAQLALNLAQGRYNLGLSSIVEVTQAQLSLTQAQIENTTAKYEYQNAYASLQYTIGALR